MDDSHALPGHPEAPPVPPLRLVMQPGGATVVVTRPDTLVGRHSQADVCLRIPDVSRRHCRLLYEQGRWQVIDLQSMNGTFVNGQLVDRSVLNRGDVLGIGALSLEVEPADEQPTHEGSIAGSIPQIQSRRLAS